MCEALVTHMTLTILLEGQEGPWAVVASHGEDEPSILHGQEWLLSSADPVSPMADTICASVDDASRVSLGAFAANSLDHRSSPVIGMVGNVLEQGQEKLLSSIQTDLLTID